MISNDAKGCYDRIAHSIVTMAMRRLGASKPSMKSMITTIQLMHHHIRTAFGDSENYYGPTDDEPPPQGILQGNGAGPCGWFSICTPIVNVMKKQGFGLQTLSTITQRAITIVCFAFVDDADLIVAEYDRSVSSDALISRGQKALYMWEGLIRASGGRLAPKKSYWHLVDVVWTGSKWSYAKEAQPQDHWGYRTRAPLWK